MVITVSSGIGTGSTLLSAFDDALFNAGVHNYNLLYLSSVIPPGAEIVEVERFENKEEDFGNRLYVVRALESSDIVGEAMAAGVGWYQLEGSDGRGFFVEHEEKGIQTQKELEEKVQDDILYSLAELCERRGLPFVKERAGFHIAGATVTGSPASVFATAVFKSEKW